MRHRTSERGHAILPDTDDLEPVRERLREWGHTFRDRPRLFRAPSAEGNYPSPQRHHLEPVPGDLEVKPTDGKGYNVRRAVETWEMIRRNFAHSEGPNLSYRSLTFWYAFLIRPGYRGPPIHIALRSLSRRAGYRVDQQGYCDMVMLAECKLLPQIYNRQDLAYIASSDLFRPSAERSPNSGKAFYTVQTLSGPALSRASPFSNLSTTPGIRTFAGPTRRG